MLDDEETLFVISSDFTHYGEKLRLPAVSHPRCGVVSPPSFAGSTSERSTRSARGDAAGFAEYVRATGITICGRGPIEAFLSFARGRLDADLAAYQTSLDVTGDFEHSVSYAALVFHPVTGAAG